MYSPDGDVEGWMWIAIGTVVVAIIDVGPYLFRQWRRTQGTGNDLVELGSGDASSTVISSRLLDRLVAPYDSELIELAHRVGQRIAYRCVYG